MIGLGCLLLVLFPLPLRSFALQWGIFLVVAAVVSLLVLPFFASIVSVAFTIVVDDEVVLIESSSNHLLVSFFIDFVVDGTLVLYLVCLESRLPTSTLGPKLGKSASV